MCYRQLMHTMFAITLVFFCSPVLAIEFDQEDKDITTNGNMVVAVEKLKNVTPEELDKSAQIIPVSDVTKKIYTTIGKPIKIRGKAYKVEELPPGKPLPGVWTDILLLVKNKNAPLGVTTVEFLYKGDSSEINSNDIVTCTGYMVGTYESTNSFGGTVEAIVLVGNHLKKGK